MTQYRRINRDILRVECPGRCDDDSYVALDDTNRVLVFGAGGDSVVYVPSVRQMRALAWQLVYLAIYIEMNGSHPLEVIER